MKKAQKADRRTIRGVVASISKERCSNEGTPVINLDLEIPGQTPRQFIELAFWGEVAVEFVGGRRLNEAETKWVKFQPPLKKGVHLRATGNYQTKTWKPTKSKALGKVVKKGSISVYSLDQVSIRVLPKR